MSERAGSIFEALFPSPEMAAYLAHHTLTRKQMRDAAACAPVTLMQKQAMFFQLASGKHTAKCPAQ